MLKFNEIVKLATTIKTYVEKENKLPNKANGYTKAEYSYILTKSILNLGKEVNKLTFKEAPNPNGDTINKSVTKKEYTDMANDVNKFISKNKRLPNFVSYQGKKININLTIYCFSKIIIFYHQNNRHPATCKYDSSIFQTKKTSPTIKPNETYTYFVKKTGFKGNTIDEVLTYVQKHGKYEYYYNGHKTNKTVTDKMAGNCTDWLQWLINIAEALGYEWKCLHVKCQSGTGHVRGKFRHKKHTEGTWIYRDPAAVANGNGVRSNWCMNGTLLATNPSWFMETLRK